MNIWEAAKTYLSPMSAGSSPVVKYDWDAVQSAGRESLVEEHRLTEDDLRELRSNDRHWMRVIFDVQRRQLENSP